MNAPNDAPAPHHPPSSSSWGAAFASAASVPPEGGDLTHLDEAAEVGAAGGDGDGDRDDLDGGCVSRVSRLARSVMVTAADDDDCGDEGTPPRPRPPSPSGCHRTITDVSPSHRPDEDERNGDEEPRGKKRRRKKKRKKGKGKRKDGDEKKNKRRPNGDDPDPCPMDPPEADRGLRGNGDARAAGVKRRRVGTVKSGDDEGVGGGDCREAKDDVVGMAGDADADEEVDADEPTYEGRMVPADDDGGSGVMMVLIDRSTGTVYSSTEWTTAVAGDDDDDGDDGPGGRQRQRKGQPRRVRVGKLVGGKVVLDSPPPLPSPRTGDGDGQGVDADETATATTRRRDNLAPPEESLDFPYPTDPDDHCESPLVAYLHIVPLLRKLSTIISGDDGAGTGGLSIYDPYYCDGSVVERLGGLGFPDVYNKREDCYAAWDRKEPSLPPFDALVTNPPYSGDHMERLVRFVTSPDFGDRAWFVLAPSWLHKKDYYVDALAGGGGRSGGAAIRPLYLVPKRRYVYVPPRGFRSKRRSDTHRKSAPFASMWFVWGGTADRTELLARHFLKEGVRFEEGGGGCELARSRSALRDLRRKHKGRNATGNK